MENKINQQRLDKLLFRAKKWLSDMCKLKNRNLITRVRPKAEEACIVMAGFKCQKCGNEKDLTIHHLIMRRSKDYMDFWRYLAARYYWGNMILLCKDCHFEFHEEMGGDVEKMGVITQKKIEKLKKRYIVDDAK